ncbi:unnamed protein product [Orchesella dallaii]|uniref:N-acetyltransferase domain-containing protein n=1 Tax=Orchesella dallaii TaxID=48710 RepID=A0ABP1RS54_9HEXA
MSEQVEGEWKNFVFRMALPSDHPAILTHIHKSYIPDEPLGKHIGREEAMSEDFNANVQAALDKNLTFMAIDKLKNKIAGVRLISIRYKNENIKPPPNTHKKSLAIRNILSKISDCADIFQRYPEIDHYADFILVSVDKEYRGCGLASEIYERAYKMLKAMKIPLIKCIFTNPYTEKIAVKTGFQEVARIRIQDWKYDDGKPCAPNATDEDWVVVMVKELL